MPRLSVCLALLSAAIIAYQLVLMEVLSIVQWYHFAYMIISVAMLGFGAAGTFLAIFRKQLLERFDLLLPVFIFLCSIVMAGTVRVSQTYLFRFDSYLVFAERTHVGKLVLSYILFFLPFFFGALAIGIIFTKHVEHIGSIYFANLLGSGTGGISVLALFFFFMPEQLPALIASFATIAGILVINKQQKHHYWMALLTIAVVGFTFLTPPALHPSQFKDLSKTLLLPEAKIEIQQNSPHGLLQTVSSPALRYAPGLSLTATEAPSIDRAVFINGDWLGPQVDFSNEDFADMLDHTTMALPFIMKPRNRVLFLNAGTGTQVTQALHHESKEITMVESNAVMVKLLRRQLQQADSPDSGRISLRHTESRNFLMKDKSAYDLITLPIVGTFGGSGGMYAAMEQYLLTTEGFRQMWERLSQDGVISVTCWMDYPPRNPLKLFATIVESLEERGLQMHHHVAAIRSWGTLTFVVKKSPLEKKEIEKIGAFCDTLQFDIVLLCGITNEHRNRYNQLQDNSFFEYLDLLSSPKRTELYRQYDFRVRPATDNRPYYSQFLRWKSLQKLSEVFGSRIPYFEIGYLIIIVTLLQITVAAILLIIIPLFRIGWKGGSKSFVLLYFGGIGLGYMFVEMVLIQRLTLYFGNPIYATAVSISAMLIFSGIGSFLSEKFPIVQKKLSVILLVIIGLIIIYSFSLTMILQNTIGFPLFVKIIFVLTLLIPLAICMGFPFPTGLSLLFPKREGLVPWAWGVNGCLSVISAPLAAVIAVELGFTWVFLMAAAGYCLTLAAVIPKLQMEAF